VIRARTGAARALALAAACAIVLAGCAVTGRRPAAPAPPSAPTPHSLYPPSPSVLATPNAVPRYEPRSKLGNPPFYDVDGHRYYVRATARGYVARGVASWYGPKFFGLRTATGARYDMFAMTAAHKTLPLPCYVRVTNLQNGRSVVVRVNDRGPFVANRLIDLSYAAAAKLGMLRRGTAFVEVRAITPDNPSASELTRASESPSGRLYVQVGAFEDQANAWRMYQRLRKAGLRKAFVLALPEKHRLFRVRVGPLSGVSEYDAIIARLGRIGITDAVLEIE
jgi:peptidoglycan lytic transglycosylase